MIPWSLVFANLRRHPGRSGLTFASLVVAFLLFMLLQAIADAFSGGTSLGSGNRLIADAKYSMTDNLPEAYLARIRAMKGVEVATNVSWFGGYYRDPKVTFTTFPVDPATFFDVFDEYEIAPGTLDKFAGTRIGTVASEDLAERFGWEPGDQIVLHGNIWPQEDGSWEWTFQFVGTFADTSGGSSQPLFLIQYDYFNAAVAGWAKNQLGFVALRTADGYLPEEVAARIDATFANSADPTRTSSEDQYTRQFASRLGDIGLISSAILGAVFFTILLLTGNTASQTFRERVPELAVLKTLGFTDATTFSLVLVESVALCLLGGTAGVALAFAMEPVLTASLGGVLGSFRMSISSAALGIALAAGIGVVIGIQPALAARRLSIVDALRDH